MRVLNNLKLITKLAVPVALFIAVTIGLIVFAKSSLDTLASETQLIVDTHAARRSTALSAKANVNDAAIQEKNLIIETRVEQILIYDKRFNDAKEAALRDFDNLIALSDSPDIRSSNEALKKTIEEYFAVMGRSIAHTQLNESEEAFKLSTGEGQALRDKAMQALDQRIEANIQALTREKTEAADLASSTSKHLITASVIGLTIATGLLGAIMVYGVARPLNGVTGAMGQLANGDLSVDVTGTERKDEVGTLARSLQVFKDNAVEARRLAAAQDAENQAKMRRAEVLDQLTKRFELNVSALTQGLFSAATEMEATAQSMTAIAGQTTQQSVTVASVAQQTSANVQTVAAATEELSISIREIASQVAQSSQIADRAVEGAQHTNGTVQELAAMAAKIGNVVQLINTIAGQTNLCHHRGGARRRGRQGLCRGSLGGEGSGQSDGQGDGGDLGPDRLGAAGDAADRGGDPGDRPHHHRDVANFRIHRGRNGGAGRGHRRDRPQCAGSGTGNRAGDRQHRRCAARGRRNWFGGEPGAGRGAGAVASLQRSRARGRDLPPGRQGGVIRASPFDTVQDHQSPAIVSRAFFFSATLKQAVCEIFLSLTAHDLTLGERSVAESGAACLFERVPDRSLFRNIDEPGTRPGLNGWRLA
jgi:methyl-accepting chemotaxis protein